MTNWVKHNAEKYKSEIKSLVEIINTQTKAGVPVNQFTADMLLAMRSGRKITYKMEKAINNIIKRNQPEFIETRNKWVMSVVPKIDLVIERLKYTSWTEGYRANSLHFLKSIIDGELNIPNELTERIRDAAFQIDLDQNINKKLN